METVSIHLPDDVLARLRDLEQATGQSGSSLLTEPLRNHLGDLESFRNAEQRSIDVIRDYLDDIEDLYDAQQRMIEIRAGRSKTIPLEKVMKRYGLES